MYSDKIEHICAYCLFAKQAKGIEDHIYCDKLHEYKKSSSDVCKLYDYDILKRPVRRRKSIKMNFKPEDFSF